MKALIEDEDVADIRHEDLMRSIEEKVAEIKNYVPRVGIFGSTGAGKSSLCNALFGDEVALVDPVRACTRELMEIQIGRGRKSGRLILIDFPGVGETPERNREYFELYEDQLSKLDLVLWIIKADDRAMATGLEAYRDILLPNLERCPVVFVLSQSEKMEPMRDWKWDQHRPGPLQAANLKKKISDVVRQFKVKRAQVCAISAHEGYNIIELVDLIVEVLPREKKFSLVREAKQEVVSEKATKAAEKGVWETVKDYVGKAWDSVKDEVGPIIVSMLVDAAKALFAYLKKPKK